MEVVAHLITLRGLHGRPLRRAIALLADGPQTLEGLVRACALPRRSIEELLAALGGDLKAEGAGLCIRHELAAAYRERFGYEQLRRTEPADPLGSRLEQSAGLVALLEEAIAAAPAPRRALDHVPATAETVARRALWLDSVYDLASAHVLFLGDHDLTALAVSAVRPEATVTVVDVDDPTLAFVDREAARRGLRIRCLFADLRVGLPPAATGWADLVVTDPPYTPEGVELFLVRGAQALQAGATGRVVMAYGFSDRQPALGLKVQEAALALGMVFEAILPHFNRYRGAQAIGSASDLYVCRPTARTGRRIDGWEPSAAAIYTRGPQAVESGARALDAGHLLRDPVRDAPQAVAIGLDADPGGLLLRALLACDAEHASVLVPNDHPDLATQAGQRRLIALLESKYKLRLRRSHPEPRLAVVEATLVDPAALEPPARLVRRLLSHAHGTVANIWREGLIDLTTPSSSEGRGGGEGTVHQRPILTRNQARGIVAQACTTPGALDARLIDLPRHQLELLLAEVAASATYVIGSTS